jgi:hypothetical protein
MTEAHEVEGVLGMGASGYGKPLVPVGDARPPQHVYRVMSTAEFDQARERGYIKSDERMNLGPGEGTVTSLQSTGTFYAPTDGSDYRVVRIKYDDKDGWRTDSDSYIKTDQRVPFDQVDLFTTPVSQSRVAKHGSHNQASHNPHKGGASDLPEGWAQRSRDDIRADYFTRFSEHYPNDPQHASDLADDFADRTTEYNGPNGTRVRVEWREPDATTMRDTMEAISTCQSQVPVDGLTVVFGSQPFRDNAGIVPDSTKAFVLRGEKQINMRPEYAQGAKLVDAEEGYLMPSAGSVSEAKYIITHEYGHVIDKRSNRQIGDDYYALRDNGGMDALSTYGRSND